VLTKTLSLSSHTQLDVDRNFRNLIKLEGQTTSASRKAINYCNEAVEERIKSAFVEQPKLKRMCFFARPAKHPQPPFNSDNQRESGFMTLADTLVHCFRQVSGVCCSV